MDESLEQPHLATSLGEVLSSINIEAPGQRTEMSPFAAAITADELQTALQLPIEIGIGSIGGKATVITGRERSVPDTGTDRDSYFLHTHHASSENPFISGTDLYKLAPYNERQEYLASPEGLVLYGKPTRNPLTGEPTTKDTRDLWVAFGDSVGVDLFSEAGQQTLTAAQHVALTREFCAKAGVLRDSATWDDEAGVARILAELNNRIAKGFTAADSLGY